MLRYDPDRIRERAEILDRQTVAVQFVWPVLYAAGGFVRDRAHVALCQVEIENHLERLAEE